MEQVEGGGWAATALRGGRPLCGDGPQLVNAASRFGVEQGSKLRAVDDIKRGWTERAAAMHTLANLPTWGHFAGVAGYFREEGLDESLVLSGEDHEAAYEQLPERET